MNNATAAVEANRKVDRSRGMRHDPGITQVHETKSVRLFIQVKPMSLFCLRAARQRGHGFILYLWTEESIVHGFVLERMRECELTRPVDPPSLKSKIDFPTNKNPKTHLSTSILFSPPPQFPTVRIRSDVWIFKCRDWSFLWSIKCA
ncbi:hypothetical protein YC2023_085211 [Brassica napus]